MINEEEGRTRGRQRMKGVEKRERIRKKGRETG